MLSQLSTKLELELKLKLSLASLGQVRPKGGLFIAWKKTQMKKMTRIMSENFRIQAFILHNSNRRLFIINTYFPCDSQKFVLTDSVAFSIVSQA